MVYGYGQGQAEPWLISEEACLTLDLLSLNHISRLTGVVMSENLFEALQNLWKKEEKRRTIIWLEVQQL